MMKKRFVITSLVLISVSAICALPTINDPYFQKQWALRNDGSQVVVIRDDTYHSHEQTGVPGADIGWLEAQAVVTERAKTPVIVAVLDSGIDTTHPDLQGRIADGGFDFLLNTTDMQDPVGHGTEVSGVIVASANNSIGIAGVAPQTSTRRHRCHG